MWVLDCYIKDGAHKKVSVITKAGNRKYIQMFGVTGVEITEPGDDDQQQ